MTYEAHKSKTTDKKDSTAKSTGAEASVDDRLATEVYSTTFNGLPFKMEVRVRSYDECDVKVTVGAEVQHHELTKADTKLVIDEWNKGLAVLATMTKLGDEMIAGLRRPLAEWLVEFEEGIDKLSENGVLEMAPPLCRLPHARSIVGMARAVSS